MKTFSSLAFALALLPAAQAQFGEWQNGTAANELFTDAALASSNARCVITGFTDKLSPRDMLLILRNDPAGFFGSTAFENIYALYDQSGNRLMAWPIGVRELSTGHFLMVGNYTEPISGSRGVYMAKFDAGGNPIAPVMTFRTTGDPDAYIDATAMTLGDPTSDRVFITGNVDLTPYAMPNPFGIFAVYVNGITLAIGWSKVYDIPSLTNGPLVATDIIQNRATSDVLVVGHGSGRAFLLTALGGTGALVPGQTFTYDLAGGGSDERIYAIDKTMTTNNFVVAGTTDVTGGSVLAFRINLPAGTVTAQTNIQYSAPFSGMRAHDVRTWRNLQTGRQEFFICGTGSPGLLGGFGDMVVLKRDQFLNPLGEYSYGTQGEDVGFRVLPDAVYGMTVIGTTYGGLIGQGDIHVTKAYRNGVIPPNCPHVRTIPPPIGLTLTRYVESPLEREPLPPAPDLLLEKLVKTTTVVYCPESLTVMGGVNAMVLAGEDETQDEAVGALRSAVGLAAKPFPNPLPARQSVLNLPINSPIDQMIQVTVTDLTGRVVLRRSIAAGEGESLQPLALPELPPGIYALGLAGEGFDEAQIRFAVE